MRSLTVSEAQDRARTVSVDSMNLDFDLDAGGSTFGSRTTIRFTTLAPGDTFVDVQPARLHEMTLDGTRLDPALLDGGRLPLRQLVPGPHVLEVSADMSYSHDGEGLHRAVDPADGETYLYMMSFLDAAPRSFACFDQPDLKAPYRVRVTVPASWTVVGNGRATPITGRDGSEQAVTWELAETPRLATYFVTVVAGPYHSRTAEHDGIRLGLHVKQSLAAGLDADLDEIVGVTSKALDRFHEMFGIRYPFGDYQQVFVPGFNAGAMENPGCVTLRDSMIFRGPVPSSERTLRAVVIVHEMAHMWFGDLVTMRWWDDLWLNESFADYMGYRVTDEVTDFGDAWVEFAYNRKRWGLRADLRPSSHPVAGNGAADAQTALQDFDGISYAKGAAVLKQLAAWLGDDAFLAGVRDHLRRHAYGNAELADLLAAWGRVDDRDVASWAHAWLREPGADTLRVVGDELVRTSPAAAGSSSRPHGITVHRIDPGGAVTAAPLQVVSDRTPLPLATAPGALLVPDALDQTWAKIRLDPTTTASLPERLVSVADPVTRGSIWLALRDAFDDADLDPEIAIDLLVRALAAEDQEVGIRSLAAFAIVDVVGRALGGAAAARDRVAVALRTRMSSAAPGSGLQLAAARGFVTATADAAELVAWLAGDAPAGLEMDAEMRWRTLQQAARWGAVDGDRIDAELARDRSNAGEAYAAGCRAARPDPSAKAAAWHTMTQDADVSNHVLYATCESFWWPEQARLTDPYVDRYFTEMPATGAIRQGWVVAEAVGDAYPAYAVRRQTLAEARRLIDDPSVDSSVRRRVVDATDDLRRALAVRERWVG